VIGVGSRAGNDKTRMSVMTLDGRIFFAAARRRRSMTTCKSLGAALALLAALAAPALAQEVIQEPGEYAFYHPNGDLRIGTAPPLNAMASQRMRPRGALAGLRTPAKTRHVAGRASPARRD
jgi:hypothetical protein